MMQMFADLQIHGKDLKMVLQNSFWKKDAFIINDIKIHHNQPIKGNLGQGCEMYPRNVFLIY